MPKVKRLKTSGPNTRPKKTAAQKRSEEHNSDAAASLRYNGLGLVKSPFEPLPKNTDPNSPEAVAARYFGG